MVDDDEVFALGECDRHRVVYGAMNLGRERQMPPAGLPQGSSNGQAAALWVVRVNSDLPLGRHPEGCQPPADAARPSRFAVGFAEPCTTDHRPAEQSLPTEGKIRAAPLCGLRPAGEGVTRRRTARDPIAWPPAPNSNAMLAN